MINRRDFLKSIGLGTLGGVALGGANETSDFFFFK